MGGNGDVFFWVREGIGKGIGLYKKLSQMNF